jgi:hypothetical protein
MDSQSTTMPSVVQRPHVPYAERLLHGSLAGCGRSGVEPLGVVGSGNAGQLEPEAGVGAPVEAGEAEIHDPDLPVDVGIGHVADAIVMHDMEPDRHSDATELLALADRAGRQFLVLHVEFGLPGGFALTAGQLGRRAMCARDVTGQCLPYGACLCRRGGYHKDCESARS